MKQRIHDSYQILLISNHLTKRPYTHFVCLSLSVISKIVLNLLIR